MLENGASLGNLWDTPEHPYHKQMAVIFYPHIKI